MSSTLRLERSITVGACQRWASALVVNITTIIGSKRSPILGTQFREDLARVLARFSCTRAFMGRWAGWGRTGLTGCFRRSCGLGCPSPLGQCPATEASSQVYNRQNRVSVALRDDLVL